MSSNLYRWEDDPICAELIIKFQNIKEGNENNEFESKDYLRPIFKWTKRGGKSFDINRANSYCKWLVMISRYGDKDRNILPMKNIQAKYAFNILITMAQRRGSAQDAFSAYLLLKEYGYDSDTFTLTALIDVIGRSENSNQGDIDYCLLFIFCIN